jgi:hypothetical protein
MEHKMSSKARFVRSIAREYISKTHPEEEDFLSTYLEEAEKTEFNVRTENGQEIPFGFGGSDLLEMFQSPIVIQILSGIWGDLLTPIFLEIIKKRLATDDKDKLSEQALRNLSRKKIRDYIRGKAKKKLLNDAEADDLAERIIDWIRRHPGHPEDIKNITTKSVK